MRFFRYFSLFEVILWCFSVTAITASFLIFDRSNYLILAASIIGVTSILINAKGNPLGMVLMIIFAVIYGVISFNSAYYGEVATYCSMTAPMSLAALISWLKNPYKGKKTEVAVGKISKKEAVFMFFLTTAVTILFYFILKFFNTSNLFVSTLSVFTSFMAVYLTARRSEWYSLVYAANDIVLIVLWTMESFRQISCVSVVICFVMFLFNDIYGFASWRKMKRFQSGQSAEK